MMERRVPPVVLAAGAAALQVAMSERTPVTASRLSAAFGVGASSALLGGASVFQHLRQRTTIDPMNLRATSLVHTGVNRITRNPMYMGLAGFLGAHAIVRGSWRSILPVGLFVVATNRYQIPAEEAALRDRLGDEFEEYELRVPRWLNVGKSR